MTKRNSSQRVQDVIDRLSDLNVRELGELQTRLAYDRKNHVLSNLLRDLLSHPMPLEIPDPDFELKEPGVAPSIDEDSLPIIRAARQNGVIP